MLKKESPKMGFNWGAFLIVPIWLLGHKMWLWAIGYAVIYLLLITIPLLRFIFHISVAIYFGISANKILWNTNRYASVEELKTRERRWTIAGVITSIISTGFVIYLIYS